MKPIELFDGFSIEKKLFDILQSKSFDEIMIFREKLIKRKNSSVRKQNWYKSDDEIITDQISVFCDFKFPEENLTLKMLKQDREKLNYLDKQLYDFSFMLFSSVANPFTGQIEISDKEKVKLLYATMLKMKEFSKNKLQ